MWSHCFKNTHLFRDILKYLWLKNISGFCFRLIWGEGKGVENVGEMYMILVKTGAETHFLSTSRYPLDFL